MSRPLTIALLLAASAGAGAQVAPPAPAASATVATPAAATAAPPTSTPAPQSVVVTGQRDQPGALLPAYAGGQVATGSRQGMLGNTDLFDTPFSTKAYTAQLIRDQGARNINDVVANDPSIRTSLSASGPLDQSSIRGFTGYSDVYLFDGLPGLVGYGGAAVQNFERVEVFKGPSTALSGAGAFGSGVGGGFNLVPKRATDQPVRSVTLAMQSGPLYGAHVDLGQRFGEGGAFGVRLNVSGEQGELYNDASRRMAAPLLALDWRGERARITLDAGSVRYTSRASFTNLRLAPGARLPAVPDPRINPNPEWDELKLAQSFGLLNAEWDFTDGWTAWARHGRYHEEPSRRIALDTSPVRSDGSFDITGYSSSLWQQDNEVNEVGVRGTFVLGGMRHHLALNALRDRERYHDDRFVGDDYGTPIPGSLYSRPVVPNPFADGVPNVVGDDYAPTVLDSIGIADTVVLLNERLRLTAAVRKQTIAVAPERASRVSPTLAALVRLDDQWSVYGNYAQALAQGDQAPQEAVNSGEQLPPYVSKQREIGAKWNGGTVGVTAALFDIRKASGLLDADNVFRATGEQRHRGAELETFGEPLRGWRVLGGVMWLDAEQVRTPEGATDGKRALGVPNFTANLGTEWDVPGWPGLTLTARAIHTGGAWVDAANTQRVPAWTTADVGARWRLAMGRSALTLRLGIDNVTDHRHWTVGGRDFVSVAPPRTWKASASWDL